MHRQRIRARWPRALLGAFLTLALLSCVGQLSEPGPGDDPTAEPPGPSMNHAKHLAKNIECADCHEMDAKEGPKLPKVATCFDCHDEDIAGAPKKFRDYFDAIRQPDGSYRFPKLPYSPDLIFAHAEHANYDVGCADCHGDHAATAYVRPPLMELKKRCMDCHQSRGASNECATCHREIRKDAAPPSHTDMFAAVHGRDVPKGWQEGKGGLCAVCHTVPQSCNDCHRESMPGSHRTPAFKYGHGRSTGVQDERFEDTSCAVCHTERNCSSCHMREMPRSHTTPFRRRLHGIAASIERQSCRTCHKQEYCDRCHKETRPLSHRGSFGSGRQTHCVACHDPLPQNSCYACHKNTLGHLLATPLPAGLPHSAATDCRTCHSILPHLDDGGNCRRCHR